jgi:hypothetical protein
MRTIPTSIQAFHTLMRRKSGASLCVMIFAFILSQGTASAQSNAASSQPDSALAHKDSIPSRESFVNSIAQTIVDSSFSGYYLFAMADPCSFIRFDYEEWTKYALKEDVPIYTLNELAEKAYHDRKPAYWEQQALNGAICISKAKADSMLNPLTGVDSSGSKHRRQVQARRLRKKWDHIPLQQRIVFYFSRPLFTDDGQFAIIDLGYRCDSRLCGIGTTCLFRRTTAGWKLIGRKVNWGG